VDNVTGHRWLFLAVDSFSAYVWGRSFLTRDAEPVAQMVMEVVSDHGLAELVEQLPAAEAAALRLTVLEGLSYRQAAAQLGRSAMTVLRAQRRALESLRESVTA
jgi:RNA polymerase sigma factor (sigma-70 family)